MISLKFSIFGHFILLLLLVLSCYPNTIHAYQVYD